MSKFYKLPSGRMLDIESIIYVGLVSDKQSLFNRRYSFKVSWASRSTYTLQYRDYNECVTDHDYIINMLSELNNTIPDENMICS